MKTILRKAGEFKATSDNYRAKYEESRDPAMIAEFYKKSFLAMKEAWVLNELTKWYMQQEFEKIEVLNLSKGERKEQTKFLMAIKRLMIFDKVNYFVSKGSTKTAAFGTIAEDFLGTAYSPDVIRNAYYAAKKFEPEIRIVETETEKITTCRPTRIKWASSATYGFWELREPKKP